jgi:hypothetical protein
LFPTYNGSEDPLSWLNRCEQFFHIQKTEEAGKVFLAAFYMTSDAAQWYALVERNHGTPEWAEFVKLVNQRFGPPLRGNTLGELIQLKWDTTIADYQNRFLALVNRCTGLSEKQQIDIFIVGLRNPLKTDVELEQPATLDNAMALARAYEQCLVMTGDSPARVTFRPQTSRPAPTTKVLALPASPAPTAQQGAATATPRLRRLTAAELAAKCEKGECFNCTEKFSWAHLDVCPMKGLFLLELDAATPDDLDEEKPLISLNAITGISATKTMTLHVHLLDSVVEALVDSGSTHSFISADTASRLHLQPVYRPGLQVIVANGDRVASVGICRDVHIVIDKDEFLLDFFIISLAGYEMVLGVQWLRTLGPILWDFGRAQMSCWRDDHQAIWHGVSARRSVTSANATVSTDLLEALLDEYTDVFSIPTGLPPPRRHNHRIHLLPGTTRVAVRPYWYP